MKYHRRLRCERLESRHLLAVVRLASWNTLNGPDDVASDADFATILEAIGNEAKAGIARPIDLLALQETDVPGSGMDSIGRIEAILDGLYPGTDYASSVSSLDGGGDAIGFVYDTATLSLIEAIEVPGTFTHSIFRGQFRPQSTTGEVDFFVYSVHLASGAGPTARASEAIAIRNDADLLGEGANVLIVGDFNLEGSSEQAWANLTALGAGQVFDVVGPAGEGGWADDPAFLSLHSQNPMGPMDDRFDLQFASGEFFDGVGIEYVASSYRVFGNNGTHAIDGAITTGTGASPAVLAALASASDHLPTVADYEIVLSTPNVRLRETGGLTRAIEGGIYDTYSVVLDTVPTDNVTVTITPDTQLDVGNGPGIARDLIFTPATAFTPQFVAVVAGDDLAGEGNHTGLISHSAVSSDPDYNALVIADLVVELVDNDAPTIVINELDSDTEGIDALEFVELYDGGVGNVDLSGRTLVFFNGANDQSYEVFDLAGYSTDANGFFVAGNAGVFGVDLVFAVNTLQNGADAVALYTGSFADNSPVTTSSLLDAVVYGTDDDDAAGLLALLEAGQAQLNENGKTNKDFDALARRPDHGTPRQTDAFRPQLPTPAARNDPPSPAIVITQSANRADLKEGGMNDSYQVALATFPTADVNITIAPDSQVDLGAGAGMAIELTFTPANAIVPQTVYVEAVDDADVEGMHTGTMVHAVTSLDADYDSRLIPNVVANITDNEVVLPPSLVISEIMYDPASDESEPGVAEWIEIVNTGATTLDLGGYLFDDEDTTNWGRIPPGTVLRPGQVAVFFDEEFTTPAIFRSEWNVPSAVVVVGITWGSLANTPSGENERLELQDGDGNQLDFVNFDDSDPWPTNSNGPSVYLAELASDNNDGANWAQSAFGVMSATSPSGPTFATDDVGSPGRLTGLPGDYNDDGRVTLADYTVWRDQLGAGALPANEVATFGAVDAADNGVWKINFGSEATPSAVAAAIQALPPERAEVMVLPVEANETNTDDTRRPLFSLPAVPFIDFDAYWFVAPATRGLPKSLRESVVRGVDNTTSQRLLTLDVAFEALDVKWHR